MCLREWVSASGGLTGLGARAEALRFREFGFDRRGGEVVGTEGDCSIFVLDEPAESLAEERVTLGDMRI